jgi:predicted Zn-dependent peptidase
LTYIRSGEHEVTTIVADVAQHVVWGGAGPGRATRPEAVATITSDDIARWRDRSWGPASAVVLVQGPWTADELVPMLEARLGDWRAPGRAPAPAPPTVTAERVVAVHVPGAAQTSIGVVRAVPALSRPLQGCDAPDCVPVDAARIASLVIGDQRVNHRLREVEGWTYSATCALERYAGGPLFSCSASVQADATVPALRAMREELDGAASRPPSDDDIGRAQRYLVDSARTWDLNAYLDAGLTLWAAGQPVTAVQDRLARTSAMGPDAVRAAAAVLAGAERAWVVVGDLDPHRDEIRALGLPYEEVDRWGEPVPASP